MAIDEEHDDGLGGRSRRRREISESNRFASDLIELWPWQFESLPEDLREAVAAGRRITSPIARKRQLQFIDSWIRDAEPEIIELTERVAAIQLRGEPALIKERDRWLQNLSTGSDDIVAQWMGWFPDDDRQRLRTLIRNQQKEILSGKATVALRQHVEQQLRGM